MTLATFCYLQVLDTLTTIAFLLCGVREANPIVRAAMDASTPIDGLLTVKLVSAILALWCWESNRTGTLARVNVGFAALIAWNLAALIASLAGAK